MPIVDFRNIFLDCRLPRRKKNLWVRKVPIRAPARYVNWDSLALNSNFKGCIEGGKLESYLPFPFVNLNPPCALFRRQIGCICIGVANVNLGFARFSKDQMTIFLVRSRVVLLVKDLVSFSGQLGIFDFR